LSGKQVNYSRLSIVIPAFNEVEAIGQVLAMVVAAMPGAEILVVDDHSCDRTCEIAKAVQGVKVIRHAFNQGQGAALKTGMRHATRDYVAWFDADNEHRVQDLDRIYARLLGDDLVAVIAQRTSGSTSLVRAVGKWVIRIIGQGLRIKAGSDLNCGLRVFQRNVIVRYLGLIPDRFSSSLVTTLVMLERRYPIAFEPIVTNPRIGYSTVRFRDGFEAILQLVRAVLLFAPMRFFLPLGLWSLLIGIVYSVSLAILAGRGIPIAGMLLILAGMLIIVLGLLADQISQLRLGYLNADVSVHEMEKEVLDDGVKRSTAKADV
jgi:glycosyltransferase involved in cell wall biosynthesis